MNNGQSCFFNTLASSYGIEPDVLLKKVSDTENGFIFFVDGVRRKLE